MDQRRGIRTFQSQRVDAATLSNLLAVLRTRRRDTPPLLDGLMLNKRAYPAAGCIVAVDFWILPLTDNHASMYSISHYNHDEHKLEETGAVERSLLLSALGLRHSRWESVLSLVVAQTINIKRIFEKYQQRGYRFALIEAGLSAMLLCQAATAFRLASLAWGGFYDSQLDAILGLDGANGSTTHIPFFSYAADHGNSARDDK
ncbi:nitroreductase family protein [Rhodobium orientis]|uniref:nitroreductase family protein n=1 Tax=Rhodobium orientis TaxID=34017 RepID=UPI001FCFFF60|nr:nitroreductase family protein [Rhodobium orientis]